MMTRLRLLALLARPAVIVLLIMYAAVGLAQAGHPQNPVAAATAVAVIAGFLLFSVACNDLADEKIDQVNLPGKRPLASGLLNRREFTVIGAVAGAEALAASALISWPAILVTAAGLAVSAGYSIRPVRLADRGAVASLVLPACYVAVPYLLGVLAARGRAGDPATLALLAGLYLGFIGRILLKDFRDVRGDVMFGKRTFLVRHGRIATCAISACCWLTGTAVILAAIRDLTVPLTLAEATCAGVVLVLLRALARTANAHREEALVAATAIVGRGMLALLLAHLSMISAHSGYWGMLSYDAVIAALTAFTIGPAITMARNGPVTPSTIPAWRSSAVTAESVIRAGEAVEGLAGAAFGDFRAAGAHPRGGQLRPGPDEPLFQVADLRL
jgi:4-hydroxybenzoate polyprenyltransferase